MMNLDKDDIAIMIDMETYLTEFKAEGEVKLIQTIKLAEAARKVRPDIGGREEVESHYDALAGLLMQRQNKVETCIDWLKDRIDAWNGPEREV